MKCTRIASVSSSLIIGLITLVGGVANGQGIIAAGNTFSPLSAKIIETSKSGNKLDSVGDHNFVSGGATASVVITLDPTTGVQRQTIEGFGGALTESSAYVLKQIPAAKRSEVIDNFFNPQKNNYTLNRLHIASCDFSVSSYAYTASTSGNFTEPDPDLSTFSIAEDMDDVIPLIKDAQAAAGGEDKLKFLSSPWSAPPWMKKNNQFFGGELQDQYRNLFAQYMVKYIQAYNALGIPIWGLTPENEPEGNGANWESMEFTEPSMAAFIASDLGPALDDAGLGGVQLFAFDHNKAEAMHYIDSIFGSKNDPILGQWAQNPGDYMDGIAVHWYNSTDYHYGDELDALHQKYPNLKILPSEATLDQLRGDSPGEGIPVRGTTPGVDDCLTWEEDDCQDTDAYPNNMRYPWVNRADWWNWWWEKNHGSWNYNPRNPSTPRWPGASQVLQPLVAGVYRYARDIITDLNHWAVGWIDWNIALDFQGGPNHVGNWCAATIMVDVDNIRLDPTSDQVRYTPIFYVMGHFSKYIKPGSKIIPTTITGTDETVLATAAINPDGSIALVLVNQAPADVTYSVVVGGKTVEVTIPGDAMQTVVIAGEGGVVLSSSDQVLSSSDVTTESSSDNITLSSSITTVESSVTIASSADISSIAQLESSDIALSSSEQVDLSSSVLGVSSSENATGLFDSENTMRNTSMFSRVLNNASIEFSVPESGVYMLNVYDFSGRMVASIDAGLLSSGKQSISVDGHSLGDGMYLIRAEKK